MHGCLQDSFCFLQCFITVFIQLFLTGKRRFRRTQSCRRILLLFAQGCCFSGTGCSLAFQCLACFSCLIKTGIRHFRKSGQSCFAGSGFTLCLAQLFLRILILCIQGKAFLPVLFHGRFRLFIQLCVFTQYVQCFLHLCVCLLCMITALYGSCFIRLRILRYLHGLHAFRRCFPDQTAQFLKNAFIGFLQTDPCCRSIGDSCFAFLSGLLCFTARLFELRFRTAFFTQHCRRRMMHGAAYRTRHTFLQV